MYTTETQTILESETVQISSEFVTDALHLTTVLMKIHCPDHCHYTIGVLANEANHSADFHMIHDITRKNVGIKRGNSLSVKRHVLMKLLQDFASMRHVEVA